MDRTKLKGKPIDGNHIDKRRIDKKRIDGNHIDKVGIVRKDEKTSK